MNMDMNEKRLIWKNPLILFAFILSFFLLSGTLTNAASNGLMGEKKSNDLIFDPLEAFKVGRNHIVTNDEMERFSDINLYDESEAIRVAKKLGVEKVVPVPRKYAIQNGEPLNQQGVQDPVYSNDSYWTIEGEYGFVPTFSDKTEVSYFKKIGNNYEEKKIYAIDQVTGKTKLQSDADKYVVFGSGEEGYIKFTNLGYYEGNSVTIVMDSKNITHRFKVGLLRPSDIAGEASNSFMSVSASGYNTFFDEYSSETSSRKLGSLYNKYGSNYVDINYTFYNSELDKNWDSDLSKNSQDKIKVRGFYTYADFDFEESIGISEDIDIHSIYVLQAGIPSNDESPVTAADIPLDRLSDALNVDNFEQNFLTTPDLIKQYQDDPLGIKNVIGESKGSAKGLNNQNPVQQYLFQYMSENSDWMNQMSFLRDDSDGFRYFNRGTRTNTEEYKVSNWLSFTYGETESFTLRVNVSALDEFDPLGTKYLRDRFEGGGYISAGNWSNGEILADTALYGDVLFDGFSDYSVSNNKLLYKIMEKQLQRSGKTDVADILEFQVYESGYTFDETRDKNKVIFGYDPEQGHLMTEFDSLIGNQAELTKLLRNYYVSNYDKYQRQKVVNSNEEQILEFLYEMLTKVDSSKGNYSAYGLNKDNIGNMFPVNPYQSGKKANYTTANEAIGVLDTGYFWQDDQNKAGTPRLTDFLKYTNRESPKMFDSLYSSSSGYGQTVTPYGSNVYFTSDTLLPIGFPAPTKKVIFDDETKINANEKAENKIVWQVMQVIPPLVINNAQEKYIFTDKIDPGLKIDSVTIKDLTNGNDETGSWIVETDPVSNTLSVRPERDHLNSEQFYKRTIEILITTSVNESAFNGMSDVDIQKNYTIEDGYLLIKNIGEVEMTSSDPNNPGGSEILYTRPDYDTDHETKTPTIGKLRLYGNLEITKVAKEDPNKHLKGASFELRKDKEDSATMVAKGITDDNGNLVLENIQIGTYWLVETSAPDGYSEIEPYQVTIYPFEASINSHKIENEIGRVLGEFDKVTKKVLNDVGQDINNELVAFEEVIEYQIKATLKAENNKTELGKLYIEDLLDKGLKVVPNTTKVTIGTSDTSLDDTLVWKKSADGLQDSLDTSPYENFKVIDNEEMVLSFKVTITHEAGKKVINQATVHASGRNQAGQMENREQKTGEVINHLGKEIHVRQVVKEVNPQLAVPTTQGSEDYTGFVRLNNQNDQTKTVFNSVSVSIPSGPNATKESDLPAFRKIFLSPSKESKQYSIEVIDPEMYEYAGYIVNQDNTMDMSQIRRGELLIDLSKTEPLYITVFVTPKEQVAPLFYNWDYKFNVFKQPLVTN